MIAYLKLCCVRELDIGTAFYLEVNNVVVDLADQGYTGLAKACVFQVIDQTAVRVCWDCPNSGILVPASPTHLIFAETGIFGTFGFKREKRGEYEVSASRAKVVKGNGIYVRTTPPHDMDTPLSSILSLSLEAPRYPRTAKYIL